MNVNFKCGQDSGQDKVEVDSVQLVENGQDNGIWRCKILFERDCMCVLGLLFVFYKGFAVQKYNCYLLSSCIEHSFYI